MRNKMKAWRFKQKDTFTRNDDGMFTRKLGKGSWRVQRREVQDLRGTAFYALAGPLGALFVRAGLMQADWGQA